MKSPPSSWRAQPGDDLMGKIIDLLFGLIAYVCVATVITLALIIGYLWHTDQLNDDKMFRLMAVMQDVDLQQIAAAQKKSERRSAAGGDRRSTR